MKRLSRALALALISLVTAGLLTTPPASAGRVSPLVGGTITNVELVHGKLVVHGQISAVDFRCLPKRTVVLDRPGPHQIASTRTDASGYWTIAVRGWPVRKRVSLWAWVRSTGKRGPLLCEGGAATRTVLYLPAVTRQYTQILNSARSILAETDRMVAAGGAARMQVVLREQGHAIGLIYRAQHDTSLFAARADAARARWFAAMARLEAATILSR